MHAENGRLVEFHVYAWFIGQARFGTHVTPRALKLDRMTSYYCLTSLNRNFDNPEQQSVLLVLSTC
jgi:hypothetical protein